MSVAAAEVHPGQCSIINSNTAAQIGDDTRLTFPPSWKAGEASHTANKEQEPSQLCPSKGARKTGPPLTPAADAGAEVTEAAVTITVQMDVDIQLTTANTSSSVASAALAAAAVAAAGAPPSRSSKETQSNTLSHLSPSATARAHLNSCSSPFSGNFPPAADESISDSLASAAAVGETAAPADSWNPRNSLGTVAEGSGACVSQESSDILDHQASKAAAGPVAEGSTAGSMAAQQAAPSAKQAAAAFSPAGSAAAAAVDGAGPTCISAADTGVPSMLSAGSAGEPFRGHSLELPMAEPSTNSTGLHTGDAGAVAGGFQSTAKGPAAAELMVRVFVWHVVICHSRRVTGSAFFPKAVRWKRCGKSISNKSGHANRSNLIITPASCPMHLSNHFRRHCAACHSMGNGSCNLPSFRDGALLLKGMHAGSSYLSPKSRHVTKAAACYVICFAGAARGAP